MRDPTLPRAAVPVALLLTLALSPLGMPPAAADPGDPLVGWYRPPCSLPDPASVTFGAGGQMAVAMSNSVTFLHRDGTCAGAFGMPAFVLGITHDDHHDRHWVIHRPGFTGPVSVHTWVPGEAMQERFRVEVGGHQVGIFDLAHDAVRDELWFVGSGMLIQTTSDGEVLRVHEPPSGVRGVAHDGAFLWLATDRLERYVVPEPGAPWPEPDLTIPVAVGRGLAFDPAFPLADGERLCALWTVFLGWPNRLSAFEAPCPARAIGDAWTLQARGPPGWTVHEHARAYAEQGASDEAASVLASPPGAVVRADSGRNRAVTWFLPSEDPAMPAAAASSLVQGLDVAGGLVTAEAVHVEAHAAIGADGPSGGVAARIVGLRIAGQEPVDVAYEDGPVVLPLPQGLGTVTLFAQEDLGDPGRTAEARITGLSVDLVTPLGAVHVEAAVAWAAAGTGGLRAHPPQAGDALSCRFPPLVTPLALPEAPCPGPAVDVDADPGASPPPLPPRTGGAA